MIFAVTGLGFVISGLIGLLVQEPADTLPARQVPPLGEYFRRAWHTYQGDGNFRRLVWSSMLFMGSMMLFPHYQALGEFVWAANSRISWGF